MRARMRDIIKNHVSSETLQGVVGKLSDDVLGKDILKSCKLIYPLKDSLIEKVKVLRKPKRDVSRLMEMHELQTEFDPIPKDELEQGQAAEAGATEAKTDAKTDTKTDTKTEAKTEAKTETKTANSKNSKNIKNRACC